MKKNILAIAIASVVATPVAFANAPTVYGQFNLAIDQVTDRGNNIVHRNSRLGVKGSEDLGNGLKAVYQVEGTVNMAVGEKKYTDDQTTAGEFKYKEGFEFDRNTFAGIAGGFGTVVMGRHDTPLRMIQPNDGFADSKFGGNNTGAFNGFTAGSVLAASGEDRANNVIAYLSPSFNGVNFAIAGVSVNNGATKDSSVTNAMSGSISYGSKSKGIYAAVAMTTIDKKIDADEQKNTRATVQFNEAGLVVSAMYNIVDVKSGSTDPKGSTITVGASYKMGAITPRAKVAMIDYDKNYSAKDSTSIAAGVDYSMGKNTSVYAEYVSLDKNNKRGAHSGVKSTDVVSVGLLHKF